MIQSRCGGPTSSEVPPLSLIRDEKTVAKPGVVIVTNGVKT
jgi:hypothetical protein